MGMSPEHMIHMAIWLHAASIYSVLAVGVGAFCQTATDTTLSTYGKEFYVPFPDCTVNTSTVLKYVVYIYNPGTQVIDVEVTFQGGDINTTPINYVIPAQAYEKVDVDANFMIKGDMVSTNMTILRGNDVFGVRLTSNAILDGFTAHPTNTWGMTYTVVTYCGYLVDTCQILVVAHEDNTEVTVHLVDEFELTPILFDFGGTTGAHGQVLTKVLNSGQAWQIQRHYDLTGSRINSNVPIGVLSGNAQAYVGEGYEHGSFMEQMPAYQAAGSHFTTFLTPDRIDSGDVIRVVGLYYDTTVFISSYYQRILLHEGQYITSRFTDAVIHIESTRPVLVVKFSQSESQWNEPGHPSMSLVIPTGQFYPGGSVLVHWHGIKPEKEYVVIVTKNKYNNCFNDSMLTNMVFESEEADEYTDTVVQYFNAATTVTDPETPAIISCLNHTEARTAVYHVYYTEKGSEQTPVAFLLNIINPPCIVTNQSPGDRTDNDCDGLVDEDDCSVDGAGAFPNPDCGRVHEGNLDTWGTVFTFVIPDSSDEPEQFQLYITKHTDEAIDVNVNSAMDGGADYHYYREMSDWEESAVINLNVDEYQLKGSAIYRNATLQLTATEEISVIFVIISKADVSVSIGVSTRLIPDDTLYGLEYFVVTHCESNECQFQITAFHNGTTTIKIQLKTDTVTGGSVTFDGVEYEGDESICLQLNQFEALQLQGPWDLTGTHITTDKPVAVMSGGRKTTFISPLPKDGLLEQMPPVNIWDRSYIAVMSPLSSSEPMCQAIDCVDRLKMVASSPSTKVEVLVAKNDNRVYLLRNAGDFILIKMQNVLVKVKASKPILVVQLQPTAFSVDLESAVLTPVSRYVYEDMFLLPQHASLKHYFMIYTPKYDSIDPISLELGEDNYVTLTSLNSFNVSYYSSQYDNQVDKPVYIVPNANPQYMVGGTVYSIGDTMAFSAPLSFAMDITNPTCHLTVVAREDGIDNDCDGQIDEEDCNEWGLSDGDNDGMYNEDCGPSNVSSSLVSMIPSSSMVPDYSSTLLDDLVVTSTIEGSSVTTTTTSTTTSTTTATATTTTTTATTTSTTTTTTTATATTTTTTTGLSPSSSAEIVISTIPLSSQTISSSLSSSFSSSESTITESLGTSTPGAIIPSTTTTNQPITPSSVTNNGNGNGNGNVPGPDGYCSCECPAKAQSNLASNELNQVIKSIQNELFVDKKEVSKAKRKLISAKDSRPSAQTVGWLGVALVASMFICLMIFDMPTLAAEVISLVRMWKTGRGR